MLANTHIFQSTRFTFSRHRVKVGDRLRIRAQSCDTKTEDFSENPLILLPFSRVVKNHAYMKWSKIFTTSLFKTVIIWKLQKILNEFHNSSSLAIHNNPRHKPKNKMKNT